MELDSGIGVVTPAEVLRDRHVHVFLRANAGAGCFAGLGAATAMPPDFRRIKPAQRIVEHSGIPARQRDGHVFGGRCYIRAVRLGGVVVCYHINRVSRPGD